MSLINFSGAKSGSTFFNTGPHINTCTVQRSSINCTHTNEQSCNHFMDLGVMCKTHQEIAALANNCTNCTCQTETIRNHSIRVDPPTASTDTSNELSLASQGRDIITALGAIIAVLVILQMATMIGWLLFYYITRRKQSKSIRYALNCHIFKPK